MDAVYKTIEQQRIHSEAVNKPFFKHNMSNGLNNARHPQNLFIQCCIVYFFFVILSAENSTCNADFLFFFSSRAAGFGQNKANHLKQTFLGE